MPHLRPTQFQYEDFPFESAPVKSPVVKIVISHRLDFGWYAEAQHHNGGVLRALTPCGSAYEALAELAIELAGSANHLISD